jgi:hypothetical protein
VTNTSRSFKSALKHALTFLYRSWSFIEKFSPFISRIAQWLSLLGKLIAYLFLSTMTAFTFGVWYWVSIKEQKPSSLPNLANQSSLGHFIANYFSVLLVIQYAYLVWIVWTISRADSIEAQSRQGTRRDRLVIGSVTPLILSAMEVLVFRLMWNSIQIHNGVTSGMTLDPLVDLQSIALFLLMVGWLKWILQKLTKWVPEAIGTSLEPVVGVRSDGLLVLADGRTIASHPVMAWPIKGIGRSRVVGVVPGPDGHDVLITDKGDRFTA